MLAYPKQSTPEELEYHSLRVMNDCENIRSIYASALEQSQNSGQHDDAPADQDGVIGPQPLGLLREAATDKDMLEEPAEALPNNAKPSRLGRFAHRRLALVSAAAILLATGAGLAAALTVSMPDQDATAVQEDAVLLQAPSAETAKTETEDTAAPALAAQIFDDRFAVADSGAKPDTDLQSHVQRQPLGEAVEPQKDAPEADLGIARPTKTVKTIAIKPDASPVLGYVPAGAAAERSADGSQDGQQAIAEATKPKPADVTEEAAVPDRPPHAELAAAEPAGKAEPEAEAETAASAVVEQSEQAAKPEAAEEKAEPASANADSGLVTISVNLRERASNNAKVLAVLPANTKVTLGSCDRWWCEATHSGQTGFIGKRYIDREG